MKQLTTLFKFPLLRSIFVAVLVIGLLIPLYKHVLSLQSLRDLITQEAEDQATGVANHLSSYDFLRGISLDSTSSIPKTWIEDIAIVAENLNLEKVVVFSTSGEALFSTDPQDIDKINKHEYFHDIASSGQTITKLVEKESKSLDGKVLKMTMVKTYIPIIHNGKIIGNFEIYHNVTNHKNSIDELLTNFNIYIVIMGIILSLLILSLGIRTTEEVRKQQAIDSSKQPTKEKYDREIIVNALDASITIDEHGTVVDFNTAAEHLFGYDSEEVVGHDIAEKIIPAELKDKHRYGLKNYLSSGFHPLINQRNEIVAVNSEGERININITIIPISVDEHILFTAFIRRS